MNIFVLWQTLKSKVILNLRQTQTVSVKALETDLLLPFMGCDITQGIQSCDTNSFLLTKAGVS